MSRSLRVLFYVLLFAGSFALFLYWMLPTEALKSRVVAEAEGQLGKNYRLEVEDLSTYWLTGVRMRGVVLSRVEAGKKRPLAAADRLEARAGLFSLIFGNPRIHFALESEGGEISGTVRQEENFWRIQAEMEGVNLLGVPLLRQTYRLRLDSDLSGEVDIRYNPAQPLRTEGQVSLRLDRLDLKKGKIPLGEMGELELAGDLKLAASPSRVALRVGEGILNFEEFRIKGRDFQLALEGRVFAGQSWFLSRLNLTGRFQFSEVIWKLIDPLIPAGRMEDLNRQKNSDATYPVSFSGQVASPQINAGTLRVFPF